MGIVSRNRPAQSLPPRRSNEAGHIVQLLEADEQHTLSLEDWAALLWAFDEKGYSDRPAPPKATRLPPGPAKVSIFAARARAGQSLWHEDDADLEGDLERLAILARLGKKQGGIVVADASEDAHGDAGRHMGEREPRVYRISRD